MESQDVYCYEKFYDQDRPCNKRHGEESALVCCAVKSRDMNYVTEEF